MKEHSRRNPELLKETGWAAGNHWVSQVLKELVLKAYTAIQPNYAYTTWISETQTPLCQLSYTCGRMLYSQSGCKGENKEYLHIKKG